MSIGTFVQTLNSFRQILFLKRVHFRRQVKNQRAFLSLVQNLIDPFLIAAFKGLFQFQILQIAAHRENRAGLPVFRIHDGAISLKKAAVHLRRASRLGVADMIDDDVELLAPEKRDVFVLALKTQHVFGGPLTLSLRHRPVFDANGVF